MKFEASLAFSQLIKLKFKFKLNIVRKIIIYFTINIKFSLFYKSKNHRVIQTLKLPAFINHKAIAV